MVAKSQLHVFQILELLLVVYVGVVDQSLLQHCLVDFDEFLGRPVNVQEG